MSYVCSKCKSKLTPTLSPGTWQCSCIYDPVSGKGHWNNPTIISIKNKKDVTNNAKRQNNKKD